MKKTGKEIICLVCGTQKYRSGSAIKNGSRFCSHSCSSKFTKNGFKEGHPSFQTEETKRKISLSNKGRIISQEVREKIRMKLIGNKHSLERRRNISLSLLGRMLRGKSHPRWNGGGIERKKIMHSFKYKEWRQNVFERDNFTCQECGNRGVILQADHIKPFAYFPKLRFEITNGRTLCVECHKLTPTYGGRAKNIKLTKSEL